MKKIILLTGLAGGLLAAVAVFAADDAATNAPATNAVAATNDTPPPSDQTTPDDHTPQPPPSADQTPPSDTTAAPTAPLAAPATPAVVPAPAPVIPAAPIPTTSAPLAAGEKGLRMNFKNAPLEEVLAYMSDAAGFIISERGAIDSSAKVTMMSAQPVSKDEAVKLLKEKLNENGYTAIQDGRTLTIVRLNEASTSEIPVAFGDDYALIPKTPDIRTQIVPVHTLNVIQLVKELDSLRPPSTTLQADEAANAIVITGPQNSVRHLMEVVTALDGINTGNATVKVYSLKYADSSKLASLIKDLFPNPDTAGTGARNPFARGFGRGGGGFPGFGGGFPGAGGGDAGADSNGHTPTAKVEATSDDNSNSLIVSAPDTLISTIDDLVKSLDVLVEDTTLVKIFPLKNADPTEMANLLTSLFPDDTSSTSTGAGLFRPFGFAGGFGGGRGGNTASTSPSDRMKKMSHVSAVPDPRTRSLVVTAGKDLMPEIEAMVVQLDSRDDGKMKVHVYPLANAEPIDVIQVLQSMFPASLNTGTSSSQLNSQTSNPLLNRAQTELQQQNNTSTTSAFGGSTSGSGRGLGN